MCAGDQSACQLPDEGADVVALVLEEAGVGSTADSVFVSASGGDGPDRDVSTCCASSNSSFSGKGEGSFERTGETGDGLGEVDMDAEGEAHSG